MNVIIYDNRNVKKKSVNSFGIVIWFVTWCNG